MKTINYDKIVSTTAALTTACSRLTDSCTRAMQAAYKSETNKTAKYALETLIENGNIAEKNNLPVCQDTGMAVFFVKLGQEVHIQGGLLADAINEGVRTGYRENGYRASVLDPVTRINTKDNTPAVIHIDLVSGDKLEIEFLPKGFGSENMSKLFMLTPSDGIEAVKRCVLDTVCEAGSKPCPPIVVGVGIGGTAEKAMELAKRQLLREVGLPSEDAYLAEVEKELLNKINAMGIGAQGFGGNNTAYAVHIDKYPTHISALPVAVNIQCNAVRAEKAVL